MTETCKVTSLSPTRSSPLSGTNRQLLWEGYHENRRCSRDTCPESYINKYTSIRREKRKLSETCKVTSSSPARSSPLKAAALSGAILLTKKRPVWFRGGLVFKAHRLVYHSTLGLRVIKKKKKTPCGAHQPSVFDQMDDF